MQMAASEASLLVPESILSCEHSTVMPSLFGEDLSTIVDSAALTAQSSETKAHIVRASLSDRLAPLLISHGLVRGITPMSKRLPLSLQTLDFAFLQLGGGSAE
jgi:hypothetical protein